MPKKVKPYKRKAPTLLGKLGLQKQRVQGYYRGGKPRPKPKRKARKKSKWPKGHSEKHSKATKLGWSRKKRLLAYQKKERGEHAVKVDRTKQARQVFSARDKKGVAKWKKAPYRYDIKGVDTAKFRIRLRHIYRKRTAQVKTVLKAGKQKEIQIRKAKVPVQVKKQRIRQVKEKVRAVVRKVTATTKKEVRATAKAFIARAKRWTATRRKRARYVARTTGATVMQADHLITRAQSKGWDYDTVNWDELQGKDLSYDERVRKLQSQVGRTTTIRGEAREIKAMMDEFDWQYEKYVRAEARRQGYGTTV